MLKRAFYFDLPEALIAQKPLQHRTDSRLLVYNRQTQTTHHQQFKQLPDFLNEGDVMVFNNSKVIPARLFGKKHTGGQVEILFERLVDSRCFWAHIRASKALKPLSMVDLDEQWQVKILKKDDGLYLCEAQGDVEEMLEQIGHIPLPPYIQRSDDESDKSRYQTVYSQHKGSVAAPTAGLHFDEAMLDILKAKGVHIAYTTLHVGAGTFQPVRVDNVADHVMHKEHFFITDETACIVNQALDEGRRVIAVGTTALRCLESAAVNGRIHACDRDTDIFITPGYRFQICKGLMTNFHLPESTLMMLVSAFIGHEQTMRMYQEAIEQQYRFFSYGDTSFLF